MNRTFHQKVTPETMVGILLMGGVALFCFWQREVALALAGALIMAVDVVAIEHTIHTTYLFTDDKLVVSRGRFAKTLTIPMCEIVKTERMTTALRTSHYILIQVGASRHISLRPDNEEAFLKEIRKRQQQYEETT